MFKTFKDAYDKYVLMEERFDSLIKKVKQIEQRIEENTHIGRICPKCGAKSLIFDYVNERIVVSANPTTGKKKYNMQKKHIAECPSCRWKCDDKDLINHLLHHL